MDVVYQHNAMLTAAPDIHMPDEKGRARTEANNAYKKAKEKVKRTYNTSTSWLYLRSFSLGFCHRILDSRFVNFIFHWEESRATIDDADGFVNLLTLVRSLPTLYW